MPKGVEHVREVRHELANMYVNIPLMPKGVEHIDLASLMKWNNLSRPITTSCLCRKIRGRIDERPDKRQVVPRDIKFTAE